MDVVVKAKINFTANGVVKSAGDVMTDEEIEKLGNFADELCIKIGSEDEIPAQLEPEVSVESPNEQASTEDAPVAAPAPSGKKKKKG